MFPPLKLFEARRGLRPHADKPARLSLRADHNVRRITKVALLRWRSAVLQWYRTGAKFADRRHQPRFAKVDP